MGCTSGKTSNPNKNLPNNTAQQKPLVNTNQPIQANQSNLNSNILNQSQNYQNPTTPIKNSIQQSSHQNSGYQNNQGLNQISGGGNPSYINPNSESSAGLNNSQLNHNIQHQSRFSGNSPNNSPHLSDLKPNSYEMHDTTDDQLVNQQKSMNFDLGIKFNMQIEVQ